MQTMSITRLCAKHGLTVQKLSRAIECGRVDAALFPFDDAGRRRVCDDVDAADQALADLASNPPPIGRPSHQAIRAKADEREIEWRRQAIAASNAVHLSLEVIREHLPQSSKESLDRAFAACDKLDRLLGYGPRGPLL